jgi:hypothetical protein
MHGDGVDGAIIAREAELAFLTALQAANAGGIPIAVLTETAIEPRLREQFPAIRFLRKPFDTRQLLAALNLPQKAILISTE